MRHEKTCLWSCLPGPTQTKLFNQRRWLEACNLELRKKRDCTIYVAKTKAQISSTVNAHLILAFVFAYAKSRSSHEVAQFLLTLLKKDVVGAQ